MHKTAKLYAYEHYDGPLLEMVELYKAKSGEELINDQIYAFHDRGERHVSIRPEMTPTVARMVAQTHREIPKPIRWYSIPNLMRYEKPQRGRLREHWQFNCDIFGGADNYSEIEILNMAKDLLQSFGATTEHFEILLNDRKIVNILFDDILKVKDEEKKYKLYKIIDKSKKVNSQALDKMLNEVIDSDKKQKLLSYLSLSTFVELEKFLKSASIETELISFFQLVKLVEKTSLFPFLKYDPSIVRGLDYYTGIVFELFDKHPDNKRAICGGGSYENLLQIFKEQPLKGVGFGLGDVTLLDFLKSHNLMPDLSKPCPQIFYSFQSEDDFSLNLNTVESLRKLGVQVEFSFQPLKPKKAFQIAEKKGAQFVILVGEEEVKNQTLQIKNLETKDEQVVLINELEIISEIVSGKINT